MISADLNLVFTEAETECVNYVARTDEQFISAIADSIQGTGADPAANFELFGARTLKCLTPEHILDIANAKPEPQLG